MRFPRVRFTVRWMMVAVAVVGIGLPALAAWARRDERFLNSSLRALDHTLRAIGYRTGDSGGSTGPRMEINLRRAAYHDALARKYEWASRYPWILVWPDPPEPE